ncbi:MAG: hypothetical protein KC589_05235 [Nanoarchaeota archaeon]|nr:hypothetical protein [Nanoarchaeota archaeon]
MDNSSNTKIKSNHWKLILIATLFNLCFEYAFRGYNEFISKPFLVLFLFATYFSFYTILEDLIVRYKLHNYQLMIAMWPLGLIPMALGTGVIFYNPQFLGINWVNLLFVEIFWWGILQAILTFYFANKFVQRNWEHPKMGKLGWTISLTFILGGYIFIRIVVPPISQTTPIGFITFLFLLIIPIIFLYFNLKKNTKNPRETWNFESSKILTFLTYTSIFLFIFLGTYFGSQQILHEASSSYINGNARIIIILWTFTYSIIFITYRLYKKKEITI